MSYDNIKNVLEQLTIIFSATEEILNEWKSDGNLQFHSLFEILAVKMNLTEKQLREVDPLIRYYIRRSPDFHVTRGAHGGIMRASDKQKKENDRLAKDTLKKQIKATVEAKINKTIDSVDDHEDDEIEEIFSMQDDPV